MMTQETLQNAAGVAMQPFAHLAEQGARALSAANSVVMGTCATCGRETFDLMSRRTRAYSSMSSDLAGCSNVQDVLQLQSRFVQAMMRDYQDHANKIAGLVTDLSKIDRAPASEGKTEEVATATAPSPQLPVKTEAQSAKRAA